MVRDEFTTIDPKEQEVERHKQEYCNIAFVTTSKDDQNKVFYTQNRCPWIPDKSFVSADSRAIVKTLNVTDDGIFPDDCSQGPGWVETLQNPLNGAIYAIKWASLVKHPQCVFVVRLWDRKAKSSKLWALRGQILLFRLNTTMTHASWRLSYIFNWQGVGDSI